MHHWYALYEIEQQRLREERDRALVHRLDAREAEAAFERENAGSAPAPALAPPARRPRRWTLRVPRLAVTITLDPEAGR